MKEAVKSDEDIRRWFTLNKKSLTKDESKFYCDTLEKWNIFFEKKFREFTR